MAKNMSLAQKRKLLKEMPGLPLKYNAPESAEFEDNQIREKLECITDYFYSADYVKVKNIRITYKSGAMRIAADPNHDAYFNIRNLEIIDVPNKLKLTKKLL